MSNDFNPYWVAREAVNSSTKRKEAVHSLVRQPHMLSISLFFFKYPYRFLLSHKTNPDTDRSAHNTQLLRVLLLIKLH